jgi:hypothetical protein
MRTQAGSDPFGKFSIEAPFVFAIANVLPTHGWWQRKFLPRGLDAEETLRQEITPVHKR